MCSVMCWFYVILLKGVPRNINYHDMKQDLLWLPGVKAVHSLNIWSLTMDRVVVSVHLAVGKLQNKEFFS